MLWHANWYHADGWVTDADWAESDGVPAEPVYEYEPLPGVPAPLVVLRLIDNYVYQTAGEPEEWRPTEAFGFVHALQGVAIDRLLRDSDLPWTLVEDDRDSVQSGHAAGAPGPSRAGRFAASRVLVCARAGLGDGNHPSKASRNRSTSNRWFRPRCGVRRLGLAPTILARGGASGRTVLILVTDHWNPDLEEWLDRVRTIFAQVDASWRGIYSPPPTSQPPTN